MAVYGLRLIVLPRWRTIVYMELLFPSRRKTPRVSVSEAEYAPAKIFLF